MKKCINLCLFLSLIILCVACSPKEDEIVVYTSVDRVYSEVIFEAFTQDTGIKVLPVYDVEATKTTGLVQRLISEKDNTMCDVFWNGEIMYTMKLKEENILQAYQSENGSLLEEKFIDKDFEWYAFGGRARVFIINNNLNQDQMEFNVASMALHSEEHKVGIAKPMFGTTATHVASLYSVYGSKAGYNLFKTIDDSNVSIVDGNGAVRDMVASGQLDYGLTDTDDALGAVRKGQSIDLVFPDQGPDGVGTLVIPNSVALINGSKHEANAKEFIDYLLMESTIEKLIELGWFQLSMNKELLIHEELRPFLPESGQLKVIDISFDDIYNNIELSAQDMNDLFLD